jgi:4-hydroxybenzoate polyprenyltransferase/phosphoserine phosphatase
MAASSPMAAAAVPVPELARDTTVLVVDLDKTLSRSDTLHEAIVRRLIRHPFSLLQMIAWLFLGKSAFKCRLADLLAVPGDELVYNSEVIDLVRDARAVGRRTALVSASHQRQVDAVADHLGLFDDAIGTGSRPDINIGGKEKAAILRERYGKRGYDYVGDSSLDLAVWASARTAYTIDADAGLRRRVEDIAEHAVHLGASSGLLYRLRLVLKAMRPHQWSKNLLVFLPILASHDYTQFLPALAAFVAFSLTASSVYLVNDLVDLPLDRAHPRKSARPFASGELPVFWGLALSPILVLAAAVVALAFATPLLLAVLGAYYVATFAYSFWIKRKLIVDVVTLAGLYTARILGGAAATGIILSPWMLAFSMFLFFSLAAIKRQAELNDRVRSGKIDAPGRAYMTDDLPVLRSMAISAGQASVLVFALYLYSPAVASLYTHPEILWLACPILLYWLSRMVIMTHRSHMTDDPIVFAVGDRVSWISGMAMAAVFLAAVIL